MEAARDAAAFLARSKHRSAVLFALRDGPLTRTDLREAIDTSQVNVGRALDDLAGRRWITREDGTYRLTPLGEVAADSFASHLETLEAVETLGEFAHLLPAEEYDFSIDRLANGSVHEPDPTDPSATLRAAAGQIERTEHVRILTHGYSTLVAQVLTERVAAGELAVEGVFAPSVFAAVTADEHQRAWVVELIESDGARIYRAGVDIPHVLAVVDDGVGVGVHHPDGAVRAILDVADPVVREWANRTFERYRATATELTETGDLPSPGSAT